MPYIVCYPPYPCVAGGGSHPGGQDAGDAGPDGHARPHRAHLHTGQQHAGTLTITLWLRSSAIVHT